MLFIQALSKAFPVWADRQRSLMRQDTKPSLRDLIADITGEARSKDKGTEGGTAKKLATPVPIFFFVGLIGLADFLVILLSKSYYVPNVVLFVCTGLVLGA